MHATGKIIADACGKNPLTPFINTDATVRDIDLARQLLGEQKINYIGYSYGTWLGDWYARLFPQHAGRFVLDSNTPFHQDTLESSFSSHAKSFEHSLRKIALPYIARHDDLWGLGTSSETIYNRIKNMSEPLRTIYKDNMIMLLYFKYSFPDIGEKTHIALELDSIIKVNPANSDSEWLDALDTVLKQDKKIDPQRAKIFAKNLLLSYRSKLKDPIPFGNNMGIYHAIICGDGRWNHDFKHWRQYDDEQAKLYPVFGGDFSRYPCLQWKLPTVSKPTKHNQPFLMIQAEYDTATPAEGAIAAWQQTPNAHMIYVTNEPDHSIFSRWHPNTCVNHHVLNYLLDGKLPSNKKVECQGVPLPREDKVYPIKGISGQSVSIVPAESSADIFPPEAQAALEEAHHIIHKAAASNRH